MAFTAKSGGKFRRMVPSARAIPGARLTGMLATSWLFRLLNAFFLGAHHPGDPAGFPPLFLDLLFPVHQRWCGVDPPRWRQKIHTRCKRIGIVGILVETESEWPASAHTRGVRKNKIQ